MRNRIEKKRACRIQKLMQMNYPEFSDSSNLMVAKGGSIGVHKHETSDDINYVLSGNGKATCDGEEEILRPGTCHICKKGSEHSIENTGDKDLVLLTMVIER